jgi:hypothetical protein
MTKNKKATPMMMHDLEDIIRQATTPQDTIPHYHLFAMGAEQLVKLTAEEAKFFLTDLVREEVTRMYQSISKQELMPVDAFHVILTRSPVSDSVEIKFYTPCIKVVPESIFQRFADSDYTQQQKQRFEEDGPLVAWMPKDHGEPNQETIDAMSEDLDHRPRFNNVDDLTKYLNKPEEKPVPSALRDGIDSAKRGEVRPWEEFLAEQEGIVIHPVAFDYMFVGILKLSITQDVKYELGPAHDFHREWIKVDGVKFVRGSAERSELRGKKQ